MDPIIEDPYPTISRIKQWYEKGICSPSELTESILRRIDSFDQVLQSFITLDKEKVRENCDNLCDYNSINHSLFGIPIGFKDSICTKDLTTTFNSRICENWLPRENATVVNAIIDNGGILLGKLNLNEFGFSIPDESDLNPPPRNPWNTLHTMIGSSSGPAVATASGLCQVSLGTDGGGSVRLPAGQANLVGIKPTRGLVSKFGCLCSSVSEIGVLSRNVDDCGEVLKVISGFDSKDCQSRKVNDLLDDDKDIYQGLNIKDMRIGVPWSFVKNMNVEAPVKDNFKYALKTLSHLGMELSEVEMNFLEEYRAANFVILSAEGFSAHSLSLGKNWKDYGQSAKKYLTQGAFLSAHDYLSSKKLLKLGKFKIEEIFGEYDLIAMPTSPVVTTEAARSPRAHRKGYNACFTAPFNLTGHPAISLPCGFDTDSTGLPLGFQLIGPYYGEELLLSVGQKYELKTDLFNQHPNNFDKLQGGDSPKDKDE